MGWIFGFGQQGSSSEEDESINKSNEKAQKNGGKTTEDNEEAEKIVVETTAQEKQQPTQEEELFRRELLLLSVRAEELDKKEKLLAEREVALEDKLKEMQDSMGMALLNEIKELILSENRDLIYSLNKSEEKLMRREADIQGFQEDFYRKVTTPYIRQFILLGDLMRRVIFDDKEFGGGQDWELQFGKVIETIDCILKDFSVKTYQEAESGENYNPEWQEVIRYRETTNPDLDKKISRSISPGYIWTLPYIIKSKANGDALPLKEYELIFRKEEVETYKLK